MSSSSPYAQLRLARRLEFDMPEFSGGLNVRDAATELAANESPDLLNVVLDERGGMTIRNGYAKWNAAPATNLITQHAFSSTLGKALHYSRADGKLYLDNGSGTLSAAKTWTAGSDIGIADFAGALYANHPVDGMYKTTNGTTWTAVTSADATATPPGSLLIQFQNKLWVSGQTGANQCKVSWCAPGDPTKWDPSNGGGANNIREGNDFPIVSLYGGSGLDFQTHPTLLIGKRQGGYGSFHRIVDPATGDFVTLDQTIGPAGPKAITSLYGRIFLVSTSGIYETDGLRGLTPIGQKLDPLFRPDKLNYNLASGFCCAAQTDRVYFSVASNGASVNDTSFRLYPNFGAFTKGTDAAASYLTYRASDDILLAASPTATGQIYRLNTGTTDDGALIQSRFLTKVFEPFGGFLARVQRIRVKAKATDLRAQLFSDFATTGAADTLTAGTSTGFVWDVGRWDESQWGGGAAAEQYAEFWPRQVGRAFQLRFDGPTTGAAWSLYGAQMHLSFLSS